MNTIQRYLTMMAFNAALGGVIKAMVRARADSHMHYVDYLYEQAKHEADRFRRLHAKEEKVEEPSSE